MRSTSLSSYSARQTTHCGAASEESEEGEPQEAAGAAEKARVGKAATMAGSSPRPGPRRGVASPQAVDLDGEEVVSREGREARRHRRGAGAAAAAAHERADEP